MEYFRSLIDNHPNVSKNNYYTIAGTNTGPFLSALWMGGLYLSDPNDGLVKEASTKLSYGTHLFTDPHLIMTIFEWDLRYFQDWNSIYSLLLQIVS